MKHYPIFMRLVLVLLSAACLLVSGITAGAVTVEETFHVSQAERVENSKSLDVMVFPSYVEFNKITAGWNTPASVKLELTASLVTNAPEEAKITTIAGDVSPDGGETWRFVEFALDPEEGTWSALVDFNRDSLAGENEHACFNATGGRISCNATSSIFATGTTSATGTQPLEKTVDAENTDKTIEGIEEITVCLRAEDSLGNVTSELFRQMDPKVEQDVHFMPLIFDALEKDRQVREPEFEKSPDRDITTTSAAWIRDQLFLRLDVAGTTSFTSGVQPAFNYYMIRFTPLETPTLNAQLGRGIYHYHTNIPKSDDPYENRLNRGFPFYVEYDGILLYQLAAIINVAGKTPGFPPIFDIYRDMLDDLGIYESLLNQEEMAASFRQVMDYVDLASRNSYSSVFWRIETETFKPEEKDYMQGVMIRFFTGFTRSRESTSIVRDDRTAYATVFLRSHVFKKGDAEEHIPENPAHPVEASESEIMKLMESYLMSN